LLVEEAKTLKIVEIKSGKTIKTDFFKGLNKFEKLANNFTVKKLLVYGGNESQKRSHVQILSWKDVKQI